MAAEPTPGPNRSLAPARALDTRAVRAHFGRAAATYDAAAVLQKEVGARMMERLDVVRLAPARVLDLGCGTGDALGELARALPAGAARGRRHRPADARAGAGQDRGAARRVRATRLGAGRGLGPDGAPRAGFRRRRHGGAAAGAGSVRAGVEQPRAAVGRTIRRPRSPRCIACSRSAACSRSRRSGPTRCSELRAAFAAVDGHPHVSPVRRHARPGRRAGPRRVRRSGDADGVDHADLRRARGDAARPEGDRRDQRGAGPRRAA